MESTATTRSRRCWRDEDLRADRQFEFRQLDLEMAFAERRVRARRDGAAVVSALRGSWSRCSTATVPTLDLRRFDRALRERQAGPSLRHGDPGCDRSHPRQSEFGVFANAASVRFIVAPKAFSRAELGRLEDVAKEWGAKGLAYIVVDESGEVRSPIAKFLSSDELARVRGSSGIDGAVRRRRAAKGGARARRSAPASRARARPDRDGRAASFTGSPTSHCSSGRRRGRLDVHASPVHAPDAGITRTGIDSDPVAAQGEHYDLSATAGSSGPARSGSMTSSSSRRSSHHGIMPEDDANASSAFSSRRSRWAPHRTAASRWASTGFRGARLAEPDIRDSRRLSEDREWIDPLTGAPTACPDEALRRARDRHAAQDDRPSLSTNRESGHTRGVAPRRGRTDARAGSGRLVVEGEAHA